MRNANSITDETIFNEQVENITGSLNTSEPTHHLPLLTLSGNKLDSLRTKAVNRYRFNRTIGFGGMKSVTEVYDRELRRNVAMATMPDWQEREESVVDRFIMEARLTARLEHPNIVPVHDLGRDGNGTPYFTMKLLKGQTLATILRKLKNGDRQMIAAYPLNRLLRSYLRICNAIAFAHSQGIIHLDLKPENIHVGEFGEVQIIDWGLARAINRPEDEGFVQVERSKNPSYGRTRDGIAKGTPGFMAPEQAAGKNREKDERTDIYTLGCILYNILTFEKPFNGQQLREVLKDTIKGNIKAPHEVANPQWAIHPALEAICLKAMEKNPADRYQSVYQLRQDIISFSSGYATEAEEAGFFKKSLLFILRNWLVIALVVLILFIMVGFFSMFVLFVTGKVVMN